MVTGAALITAVFLPVTLTVGTIKKRMTGGACLVTGREPVRKEACLSGFWPLFGSDRCDRGGWVALVYGRCSIWDCLSQSY